MSLVAFACEQHRNNNNNNNNNNKNNNKQTNHDYDQTRQSERGDFLVHWQSECYCNKTTMTSTATNDAHDSCYCKPQRMLPTLTKIKAQRHDTTVATCCYFLSNKCAIATADTTLTAEAVAASEIHKCSKVEPGSGSGSGPGPGPQPNSTCLTLRASHQAAQKYHYNRHNCFYIYTAATATATTARQSTIAKRANKCKASRKIRQVLRTRAQTTQSTAITTHQQQQKQHQHANTLFEYYIYKLTQLCFIIIFLMSLLATISQLMHHVSCAEIVNADETSQTTTAAAATATATTTTMETTLNNNTYHHHHQHQQQQQEQQKEQSTKQSEFETYKNFMPIMTTNATTATTTITRKRSTTTTITTTTKNEKKKSYVLKKAAETKTNNANSQFFLNLSLSNANKDLVWHSFLNKIYRNRKIMKNPVKKNDYYYQSIDKNVLDTNSLIVLSKSKQTTPLRSSYVEVQNETKNATILTISNNNNNNNNRHNNTYYTNIEMPKLNAYKTSNNSNDNIFFTTKSEASANPISQAQTQTKTSAEYGNHETETETEAEDGSHINRVDTVQFTKLVMQGLGLKRLPDMRKANISQQEYTNKYLQYLQRIQRQQLLHDEASQQEYGELRLSTAPAALRLLSIVVNNSTDITYKRQRSRRRRKRGINTSEIFLQRRKQRHSSAGDESGGTKGSANDKTIIQLQFPLNSEVAQLKSDQIEEANIRLMLMYSPALATKKHKANGSKKNPHGSKQQRTKHIDAQGQQCDNGERAPTMSKNTHHQQQQQPTHHHTLNLKVFHILSGAKRQLLDVRQIEFETKTGDSADDTRSQWLEFEVTKAVRHWLQTRNENLGLEVQCNSCRRIGARILNGMTGASGSGDERYQLMPVLNIIGRGEELRQLHTINDDGGVGLQAQHDNLAKHKRKSNYCYKPHQRCCRHRLDVVFKDIKGFEFIIQPKVFDAGYCQGRCPPRHNPAHHHALLQSLIWKQDHRRAPRPCCAPSKLVELEVLHVDEKDSDKLKISTWSDMQVIECACT